LSMGNPHAILQVTSLKNFPIEKFGPLIATHRQFPNGVNVGFMEIVAKNHIRLRTFERGAGETLSCGSNACAAVVSGIQNKLLYSQPDRSFHTNEIIRLTRSGTGAVQRELKNLSTAGLITMKAIGNQKHYEANRTSPLYTEVRSIVLKTFGLADILRQALTP